MKQQRTISYAANEHRKRALVALLALLRKQRENER
jgi:hypothetical protein